MIYHIVYQVDSVIHPLNNQGQLVLQEIVLLSVCNKRSLQTCRLAGKGGKHCCEML